MRQVFPGRSDEAYELPLTRTVYIEQADFREHKVKDYYGLTLDQPAMLKCELLTIHVPRQLRPDSLGV